MARKQRRKANAIIVSLLSSGCTAGDRGKERTIGLMGRDGEGGQEGRAH